jgi:hypothetical protein
MPNDELTDETVIWRYMSFSRFASMLHEGNKLFFARPFKFDDRWEGQYPPSYLRNTKKYAEEKGFPFDEFEADFAKRL